MLCTATPILSYDCGCGCLYTQFIRFATHCSRHHAVSFISGATFCYKTLFSICAHITQLATPSTRAQPAQSGSVCIVCVCVCVWPTYLAFVFIFSVIVLFCHRNCFTPAAPPSLPRSLAHCMCPCYLSSVATFGTFAPFALQAHAVDYYYKHYDRISLAAATFAPAVGNEISLSLTARRDRDSKRGAFSYHEPKPKPKPAP